MSTTNGTLAITLTPAVAAVQTSLFLLLVFLGVLGNGSICFFVLRFKSLRTTPNILLTNLATVDLLNIITVPLSITSIIYDVEAFKTKTLALWTVLITVLFVQLNLVSMLLLVVDRYVSLAHPMRYKIWKSRSKTFCAIFAVWIVCIFNTGCFVFLLQDIDLGRKSFSNYVTAYSNGVSFKKYVLPWILLVIGVTMTFSCLTVREVLRQTFVTKAENNLQSLRNSCHKTKTSKGVKSACTIMIVLLVYIMCFISRFLFISALSNSNEHSQWYIYLAQFCLFCGSVCNSFIYGARSTAFRNAWRETCKFNNKNQIHDSQRTVGNVCYINGAFGKRVIISHSETKQSVL